MKADPYLVHVACLHSLVCLHCHFLNHEISLHVSCNCTKDASEQRCFNCS